LDEKILYISIFFPSPSWPLIVSEAVLAINSSIQTNMKQRAHFHLKRNHPRSYGDCQLGVNPHNQVPMEELPNTRKSSGECLQGTFKPKTLL